MHVRTATFIHHISNNCKKNEWQSQSRSFSTSVLIINHRLVRNSHFWLWIVGILRHFSEIPFKQIKKKWKEKNISLIKNWNNLFSISIFLNLATTLQLLNSWCYAPILFLLLFAFSMSLIDFHLIFYWDFICEFYIVLKQRNRVRHMFD